MKRRKAGSINSRREADHSWTTWDMASPLERGFSMAGSHWVSVPVDYSTFAVYVAMVAWLITFSAMLFRIAKLFLIASET